MTALASGDHDIGPHNGTLRLRTYRQGLAARAGHDLVLEAAEWRGQVHVPLDPAAVPAIDVQVDLRRLDVVEGTGGVKPLSAGDKAEIQKAMRKPLRTDDQPVATFVSTGIGVDGDAAKVTGELSLAGASHPVELDVRREPDGRILAHTQVVQSLWGIRPYTGFFGALKLRDAVDVEIEVRLPS